jgi:transposase
MVDCCKFCKSRSFIKRGFIRGHQRYMCRDCNRQFTDTPPHGKPESMKILALLLYISDLSQLRIGKLLGVSDVAVLKWLRAFAEKCGPLPHPEGDEVILELDEMHSFVGSKKTLSGYGKLFVTVHANSLDGKWAVVIAPR